jgi:hypothetical protein
LSRQVVDSLERFDEDIVNGLLDFVAMAQQSSQRALDPR